MEKYYKLKQRRVLHYSWFQLKSSEIENNEETASHVNLICWRWSDSTAKILSSKADLFMDI